MDEDQGSRSATHEKRATSARRKVVRKELIKAVRKLFDESLRAQLPNFVPFKMVEKDATGLGSECRWYRWKVATDLAFS